MSHLDVEQLERLTRLLDGRATGAEREAVLHELDANPELRELYADAVAAAHAANPDVATLARKRGWVPRAWGVLGLAAAAGIAVVATTTLRRSTGDFATEATFQELARSPAALTAALAAPERSVVRGNDSVERNVASVWLGVRLTDLQLLDANRDTAVASVAREIAASLAAIPAGTQAVPDVNAIVGASSNERSGKIAGAMQSIEAIASHDDVRAGRWLELVRLAAIAGDTSALKTTAVERGVAQRAELLGDVRRALAQRPIDPAHVASIAAITLRSMANR